MLGHILHSFACCHTVDNVHAYPDKELTSDKCPQPQLRSCSDMSVSQQAGYTVCLGREAIHLLHNCDEWSEHKCKGMYHLKSVLGQ